MEMKSPPPCPSTASVRRNPPRRARATPSSAVSRRKTPSSSTISSFPIQDIIAVELPRINPNSTATANSKINTDPSSIPLVENTQNPNSITNSNINSDPSLITPIVENLKVYLRIRPLAVRTAKTVAESKNAWPKNSKVKSNSRSVVKRSSEMCVQVNDDLRSVTVSTPQSLQETRRVKSEVYEGFSSVFSSEATQIDVFEEMVKPLVDDFLTGKCGMLAAMGPSGSGKTHTVFGSAREPGMVPLALRRIFGENESSGTQLPRVYYLSMLEISSERGKSEKMIDLLHDGGDIFMHQSIVKGLQEAEVCDARQAESLIARGMLKRATATTNSNNQSSRSQCIINIRSASMNGDGEVDGEASTMLTIVDLAGAEKEKKTGNQGARLLESNFINNTSMVFGLCLRSLLEHQKNRNKQLQKHFQNSLLTRYMKDYLEGKKRMMLILTVKPGVEDYLDTSFLLRQASPFTKIKFKTIEEPVNLTCNKRPNHAMPRAQQLKRMKFSGSEAPSIGEEIIGRGSHLTREGIAEKVVEDGGHNLKIEHIGDENLTENLVLSDVTVVSEIPDNLPLSGDLTRNKTNKDREYQILQGFSKALWTALKQYKKDLEVLKVENCRLRDSLTNEKSRSLDLENELTSEKQRVLDLENELKELKYGCTKSSTDLSPVSLHNVIPNLSQYQMAELHEVNSEASSYYLKEIDQTENEKKTENPVRNASATCASCSGGFEEHYRQDLKDLSESNGDAEDAKGIKATCIVDVCFRCRDLSVSNDDRLLGCINNKGIVDLEITSQSTSACLISSHNSEQDASEVVEDEKNLGPENAHVPNGSSCPTSLECENVNSSSDYEVSRDSKETLVQLQNVATGSSTNVDLYSRSRHVLLITNDDQDLNCSKSMGEGDCEVTGGVTSECPSSNHNCKQGDLEIVNDEKNWAPCTGSLSIVSSCSSSLESDSSDDSSDHEDINDPNRKLIRLPNATGNEDQIDSVVDHSETILNISVSPRKGDICVRVDEEEHGKQEDKINDVCFHGEEEKPSKQEDKVNDICFLVEEEEPSKQDDKVTNPPNEGGDGKTMSKIVTELSCRNFQHTTKPKRRLLPAASVLLKDISTVDIKDENDKPKGARGAKIVPVDDKKRTQGSLSLLHLLKTQT